MPEGEIFVLYVDPNRRNEEIGTILLDAITHQQKEEFYATKQWVSVEKDNQKGIPFHEAKGFVYEHEIKYWPAIRFWTGFGLETINGFYGDNEYRSDHHADIELIKKF